MTNNRRERQRIVIEGDVVYEEHIVPHRAVRLTDFLGSFGTKPITLFPLPKGTHMIHYDPGTHTTVMSIEIPPGVKTVTLDEGESYQLAMPWTYMILSFQGIDPTEDINWVMGEPLLYWSPKRIDDMNGILYVPRLPNVYESARICLGSTAPESTGSLRDRVDTLTADFFSEESEFNKDLGWNIPYAYTQAEEREEFEEQEWDDDERYDSYFWEGMSDEDRERAQRLMDRDREAFERDQERRRERYENYNELKGFEEWQNATNRDPYCWMNWHWDSYRRYSVRDVFNGQGVPVKQPVSVTF